ncbi:integrin beta-7 isoform X1 [Myotis myotis]|uniref:integrin beta-7 isoform X1 n=1 Tax=Myotis myotis TaxID=51298 RepID=UPI00174E77DC|nr:integrin beta-7 isoform X1 [Myotis myotis]
MDLLLDSQFYSMNLYACPYVSTTLTCDKLGSAMVALSMVLVFLLVLSRSESELDAKISSPGEATEWGDPDLSLLGSCKPAPSCKKCILSHPSCAWCKQLNFTASGEAEERRCASREELLARGCPPGELEEPQGQQEVLQDQPLSQGSRGGEGATQLAPQRVRVTLRPGEPQQLQVRFLRAEGYPVDLYYLMDLSYSMKDDLEFVRQLGHALLVRLQEVTKSVRIGFGSFVDKTVLPFVSTVPSKLRHPCPTRLERCQPPFSFHHVLSLTGDAKAFEREVGRQSVSGNLDSPEGGFDAILQAALCQEQIGWRNVSRLLVFTSDDTFHTAGDGKLGGIFMPSDGHCHLDSNGLYSRSPEFDYPSVGQVAQALSAANIQPIFAVTSATLPVYQELSKLIPKSAVGELSENSSNVVQLIMDAYNSLSSTVTLEHSPLPPGVHISYESQCGGHEKRAGEPGDRGQCNHVRINQTVNFLVTFQATRCLPEPHFLKFRALGFSEELTVELHTLCDCNCHDTQLPAPHCSDHGHLQCGVCSCDPGRLGRLCECTESEMSSPDLESGCRGPNGTGPLCSGKGRCQCGRCSCSGQSSGRLCECDDASCERHEGILCGGFGLCQCGVCHCHTNRTGRACECSGDVDGCVGPEGRLCSGHGHCKCNRCQCLDGYYGALCDQCPGCKTPCERHRDCAECGAFGTGVLATNCSMACAHTNVTVALAPMLDDGWCKERTLDNQLFFFLVEEEAGGRVTLRVRPQEKGADHTQAIVLGCVGGIVAVGLGLVLAYRLSVEIYDRREYKRFEKERQQPNWKQKSSLQKRRHDRH